MQLDQAHIAIRQRSWLDNLDLALHVIRAHAAGVFIAGVAGALPMIVINYFLLNALFGTQLAEDAGSNAVLLAILLVMIEAPLATAPVTLYLGQVMFLETPNARQIARDLWQCLPQLMLFQVLLRTVLIVPVVTWFMPYGLWPYLNEIILLERSPLMGNARQLSTRTRSSLLHRNFSGDYVTRAAGAGLLALALMQALLVTQRMVLAWLFGFEEGWTAQVIALQAVLWTITVYFTVARFLMYLDQRIRNEGWEVELYLRAQRDRLARPLA